MKIRFLMNVTNAHGSFRKGQEVDYPDRAVGHLLDTGLAVSADGKGLAAIPFASPAAEKLAKKEKLNPEDFAGHPQSGESGYTVDDIRAITEGDDE